MKLFSCYRCFTSRIYRLCTFVLLPLALIFMQVLIFLWNESFFLSTAAAIFTGYFTVWDIWVFGGSCTRREFRIEQIKSSAKCDSFLRKALTGDCLVRFVVTALTIGVCAVIRGFYLKFYLHEAVTLSEIVAPALVGTFVSFAGTALALLICRHFLQAWVVMLISYFAAISVFFFSGIFAAKPFWVTTLFIAVVVSIGASVLNTVIVLKNVRRSYYDERVEV